MGRQGDQGPMTRPATGRISPPGPCRRWRTPGRRGPRRDVEGDDDGQDEPPAESRRTRSCVGFLAPAGLMVVPPWRRRADLPAAGRQPAITDTMMISQRYDIVQPESTASSPAVRTIRAGRRARKQPRYSPVLMHPSLSDLLAVAGGRRAASTVCLGVLEEAPAAPDAMANSQGAGHDRRLRVAGGDPRGRRRRLPRPRRHRRGGAATSPSTPARRGGADRAPVGRALPLREPGGSPRVDRPSCGTGPFTWVSTPSTAPRASCARPVCSGHRLLHEGMPVAGVLGCPTWQSARSRPAGCSSGVVRAWGFPEPLGGGGPEPAAVSAVGDAAGCASWAVWRRRTATRQCCKRSSTGRPGRRLGAPGQPGQVRAVASGMAEVYLRPRSRPDYRDCIWDHAAGAAVWRRRAAGERSRRPPSGLLPRGAPGGQPRSAGVERRSTTWCWRPWRRPGLMGRLVAAATV